jgi:hypothetical protein
METSRRGLSASLAILTALVSLAAPPWAAAPQVVIAPQPIVVSDGHNRIADPKLQGGGARASFHYNGTVGSTLSARADVYGPGGFIKTVWTGTLVGGAPPTTVGWDGKDAAGLYVITGDYTIAIAGPTGTPIYLKFPVTLVRLGVTEIQFQDPPAGNDEWQSVYFKKNGVDGIFYATPAIHEYANLASADVSNLDLNNGNPRPAVAKHTGTDEPIMNGINYETEQLNYPLAYERGATPRLQVTLGNGGTTVAGAAMSSNYPVSGFLIRMVAAFPGGTTGFSGAIAPGGLVTFDGDPLPNDVSLTDWTVVWSWQYSGDGGVTWKLILGTHRTDHRLYTIWGDPLWIAGASGTQYTGPWVEVADYVASWHSTLGISTATATGLVETFVKGFFGQNGGLPAAIEGVIYDAYPLGGDGGANHYMGFSVGSNMDLSALLNAHANGVYVNCSDNMGASTTMLSMLGLPNVKPLRLGFMQLNAIWGIGSPAYTTNLWGTGHSFGYHHITTRTNGVDVIDTCMQLDADGNPGSTPGIPGWNVDRPWAGVNGYMQLAATNPVSTTLETLPGLQ